MAKKTARREFLKKTDGVTAGFAVGMLGNLKFDSAEGIRIGRPRVSFGFAEAYAECGSSYDCAGGGGEWQFLRLCWWRRQVR